MSAYIFLADRETEPQCLERLLFGTTAKFYPTSPFLSVGPGDILFLYNYDLGTIRGPFRAVTTCSKEIEPDAFKDSHKHGFPFQVRVSDSACFETPINIKEVTAVLTLSASGYPQSRINDSECGLLIQSLAGKNNTQFDFSTYSPPASAHYIFKCNRTTGGRVFHENLFGAPAEVFKPVVSKVQEGDYLFLWLIEERKLYGVWKAQSRGQYNPIAFPEAAGKFPSVVYASRLLNVETGLDESMLRSMCAFDGSAPPYSIPYENGQNLLRAFQSIALGKSSREEPKSGDVGTLLTEDGHWVRSKDEARIDDWLFNHKLTHAYEYRVQRGQQYRKCDFYLPAYQVYIEYWGMIGKRDYDKSRREKIEFYKQAGLTLVELYPKDMEMLSEIVKSKLASVGVRV